MGPYNYSLSLSPLLRWLLSSNFLTKTKFQTSSPPTYPNLDIPNACPMGRLVSMMLLTVSPSMRARMRALLTWPGDVVARDYIKTMGIYQRKFQGPKKEVPYIIKQYVEGISPYIGLIYGRYLQFILGTWNLLTIEYTLQQTNIAMKNDSSIDDLPITLLHDDCHSYVQRSGVLNHNTWCNPLIWSSILDGYILEFTHGPSRMGINPWKCRFNHETSINVGIRMLLLGINDWIRVYYRIFHGKQ